MGATVCFYPCRNCRFRVKRGLLLFLWYRTSRLLLFGVVLHGVYVHACCIGLLGFSVVGLVFRICCDTLGVVVVGALRRCCVFVWSALRFVWLERLCVNDFLVLFDCGPFLYC